MTMNLESARRYYGSGVTRPVSFRRDALEKLERWIVAHEAEIADALSADFRKPRLETVASEIAVVIEEIRHARKNLGCWMKPRSVRTPLALFPASSRIYREPLGVVLIIGPWNYPFHLVLAPLVAAIAAGNCAVLKPSELAPHTSALIRRLASEVFDPDHVSIVEGGAEETTRLLRERFDHIFFTGSAAVGKIVMKAAAENLTPVTLELGGKSPAIVGASADLDLAARRICWGKFVNAGQTCIAPDYVYAHESIADELSKRMTRVLTEFFGDDPCESESFARVINARHFDRLEKLMQSGRTVFGGAKDRESLYIAPTILSEVNWKDPVMGEEIFGPILPVLAFRRLEGAIAEISSRGKPLAAYLFSNDPKERELFLERFSFGGGCIGDTVVHCATPFLPFGGVGASGMGAYHGERGFLTLTHEKSVLRRTSFLDFSFRYPPYTDSKLGLIRRAFRI